MATVGTVNLPTNVLTNAFSPSSSINQKHVRSSQLSFLSNNRGLSLRLNETPLRCRKFSSSEPANAVNLAVASAKIEPLKIMISEPLHLAKYGLVHIATGDLLRAEVAAGSENGKLAREYMEKGQLVPDEIIVMPDSQENGWLLDGYPRSLSQATALKRFGFQPDLFILLEVPEDSLVETVVGRRLDPVTGKVYHLKYSPPETEEIAARLTQRFNDTEEKVKLRLIVDSSSEREGITFNINGSVGKEDVLAQIDGALTNLLEQRKSSLGSLVA